MVRTCAGIGFGRRQRSGVGAYAPRRSARARPARWQPRHRRRRRPGCRGPSRRAIRPASGTSRKRPRRTRSASPMLPVSRCLAVRGVSAPGRRHTVLPARDSPGGELGSSVRGSTGPGRGEAGSARSWRWRSSRRLAFVGRRLGGRWLHATASGRDPARLEAWGAPLSTRSSVGAASRQGQRVVDAPHAAGSRGLRTVRRPRGGALAADRRRPP